MTVNTAVPATPTTAHDSAGIHALTMLGRAALLLETRSITQVLGYDGAALRVTDRDEALSSDAAIPLPMCGEAIDTRDRTDRSLSAVYLGVCEPSAVTAHDAADGSVEIFVLREGSVFSTWVLPVHLDARYSVTGSPEESQGDLLRALAAQSQHVRREQRQREAQVRAHQSTIDTLVSDAHDYADRNSLCEQFDEFMEEHGLPGRTRDFCVRVEVTATLYLARSACSVDEAVDEICRSDVAEALDRDRSSIEFEAFAD